MKNYLSFILPISSFSNDRIIGSRHHPSFSNDRKIGSRQATIFFIAFGNLPKARVDFIEARASLREIPEVVSVRKPPLKEKARRQQTLTLENDELCPSFSNDRKIGSRQATIFFIAFGNLPKVSVDFIEARAILREIPEDASVRKPPPKEKARRQRTLTLENDEVVVNDAVVVNDEVVVGSADSNNATGRRTKR